MHRWTMDGSSRLLSPNLPATFRHETELEMERRHLREGEARLQRQCEIVRQRAEARG
jgi:hypothetical protein